MDNYFEEYCCIWEQKNGNIIEGKLPRIFLKYKTYYNMFILCYATWKCR